MKTKTQTTLALASFSIAAGAQEVLPFPPTPSASIDYFDQAPFRFTGTLGTTTVEYTK